MKSTKQKDLSQLQVREGGARRLRGSAGGPRPLPGREALRSTPQVHRGGAQVLPWWDSVPPTSMFIHFQENNIEDGFLGRDLQVQDRKLHKTRSFKFDWIPPGITDSLVGHLRLGCMHRLSSASFDLGGVSCHRPASTWRCFPSPNCPSAGRKEPSTGGGASPSRSLPTTWSWGLLIRRLHKRDNCGSSEDYSLGFEFFSMLILLEVLKTLLSVGMRNIFGA